MAIASAIRNLFAPSLINTASQPADPSLQVFIPAGGNLLSPGDGWFEPVVEIGDEVQAGDLAGWLHRLSEPEAIPQAIHFKVKGRVYSQRTFGATSQGNSLAVLVQNLSNKERS